MPLEMLSTRVDLVAARKVTAELARGTFAAGALVSSGSTAPGTGIRLLIFHCEDGDSWSADGEERQFDFRDREVAG